MKVAMTGGATGIGAATAALMLSRGHQVTAFDVVKPDMPNLLWIDTDLSDAASVDMALAQADGPYDALINNAGLPPREGFEDMILMVNFFGLKRFLSGMLDHLAPGASIVNVASRAGAGWQGNLEDVKALMNTAPEHVGAFIQTHAIDPTRAYTLSKEALIVLTLASSEAMLGRGFRINAVSPAAVSTGILPDFAEAFGARMTTNVARVGRAGEPEEIAQVIAFLASPQSGWIKGQDIVIDGGMSANALADKLDLPEGLV